MGFPLLRSTANFRLGGFGAITTGRAFRLSQSPHPIPVPDAETAPSTVTRSTGDSGSPFAQETIPQATTGKRKKRGVKGLRTAENHGHPQHLSFHGSSAIHHELRAVVRLAGRKIANLNFGRRTDSLLDCLALRAALYRPTFIIE